MSNLIFDTFMNAREINPQPKQIIFVHNDEIVCCYTDNIIFKDDQIEVIDITKLKKFDTEDE